MQEKRMQAAQVLVAKTHFAPAAAQRFVAELSDAELDELLALAQHPQSKPPLEAWLAVRQARHALQHADPEQRPDLEAGLQSAEAELRNALPPAPPQHMPGESAVPPALTVPVSPETNTRRRR